MSVFFFLNRGLSIKASDKFNLSRGISLIIGDVHFGDILLRPVQVFVRQPDRCGAALLVETEHDGGMDGMGLLGIGLWRKLRTHDLG